MLDRTRLIAAKRMGTDPVDPNTTFQEGMLLHWTANGWAVSDDGSTVCIRGIAGLNKVSALKQPIIGELVSFASGLVQNLKYGNVTNVYATLLIGTPCQNPRDYLVSSAPNGTITKIAFGVGGAIIPDLGSALFSYTFQVPLDLQEEENGMPLSNNLDETLGSGNAVVFTEKMEIATDQYDSSLAYAVNDPLYDNGDGLLTKDDDSGANVFLGYCKQPPTAGDRFMIAALDI